MFSVIIVTYNSEQYITGCIESILIYDKYAEVIVVDNASSDATVKIINALKNKHNNIQLIKNNSNLGFGVASNIGFSVSRGKFIFFCNPDIIISSNIFNDAQRVFGKDNTIGCFSPQILNFKKEKVASAMRFPSPKYSILISYFKYFFQINNANILKISSEEEIIFCDWVLGAAMIIRRDLFTKVGFFNESFFLYFEDIDICHKFQRHGYKIVVSNNCNVMHYNGGSSNLISRGVKIKVLIDSEKLYYKINHNYVPLLSRIINR